MSTDPIQGRKSVAPPASPAAAAPAAPARSEAPSPAAPLQSPAASLPPPALAAPQDGFAQARPPARPPLPPPAAPPVAVIRERRGAAASASVNGTELQDAADRGSTREIATILDRLASGQARSVQAAEFISILRSKIRGTPDGPQTFAAIGRAYGIDLNAVVKDLEKDGDFKKILNERGPIPREALGEFASYDDRNGELLRKALLKQLYRGAVAGTNPEGLPRVLGATQDRERLAGMFGRMLDQDRSLRSWIEDDPDRRRRAESLARRLAPTDPSIEENRTVNQAVDSFRDWERYPYQLIVVPGYTPLDAKQPIQMHPTQRERLQQAVRDYQAGRAPFILVSGGNVHPPGTPYYEALEMKKELRRMGIPEDRIIVDAAARHSTTNLRNTGRYMLDHNLSRALVTTSGDQDFYFSFPDISTFHLRCRSELGHTVGDFEDAQLDGFIDTRHSVFTPSRDVRRVNYKDPMDP